MYIHQILEIKFYGGTAMDLLHVGAAYIRVSDERQDEYSPDSQLKLIREHAKKDGYLIPDEYVFYDDGISGKSVKKRDDFNRMIALAKEKAHPFDRIYVWKFSRFARNQEESLVYKNLLIRKGVTVISVSQPIPEGPFGSLIERIIEWMDEFYLINLGEEVRRGMTEKASRGEPTCAPPYGYIMSEGMYYPDESGKADVVREIFTLYDKGVKGREIAVLLGQRGVRTNTGRMPSLRWIEYILRNPCYIGKIRWSLDGERAVSKYDFKNEKIMLVDGHHKPLISTELWDCVQSRLDAQKIAYPKHARTAQPIDHMLKGLVRCSSCGGTLAISGFSGKARTRCLQCCNYSHGTCHDSHSILLPRIEEAFVDTLKHQISKKAFMIVPVKPKQSKSNEIDYAKLIALEERRLERAKEAYLAEIDSIDQYAKNKIDIVARIEDLIAKRDRAAAQEIDLDAYADKVASIITFIEREDVTASEKNEMLRTIIEKVVYDRTNESLAIYFHNSQSS